MPVLIRPYAPSDADAVLALNQAALDGVGPLNQERLSWLAGLTDPALVADDGVVAGFAFVLRPGTAYDSMNYRWFCARHDDFGYLDRIVVAPSRRRQGIATLLYDAAEDSGRQTGLMVCEVYVDPPNVGSLAFHRARGYKEVGRLLQANGKTCAMLAKDLT